MDYLTDKAKEELKRADHLIYVTLKYTRTTDVIKNTIKRLISSFDLGIIEGLNHAKEKKLIKEVPDSFKMRSELIKKIFKKQDLSPYIELYYLLRKLDKLPYTKKEEYRKHVTLMAQDGSEKIDVDIPVLVDYYKRTKEFIIIIDYWIRGIELD